MNKFIKFIIGNRTWLIFACIALVLVLVPWLSKIEIGSTYAEVFPSKSNPERQYLDRFYEEFGNDNTVMIAIVYDDIFSTKTLQKIQRITKKLEKLPAVERVQSLTNANIIKSRDGELFLKNISDNIPVSKIDLDRFRKDILANPLYANNLLSENLQTTVIIAYIDLSYPDEDVRYSVKEAKRLALKDAGPEKIYVVGLQTLAYEIFRLLSSDLYTYLPLSFLIIAVILMINFRSVVLVIITLLSIGISVACTYSLLAMLDIHIFTLTATIPPIITAIGISYTIHLFTEYARQRALNRNRMNVVEKCLKNILLAIILSALTTAIGFASLILVDIVAIRRLGFFLVLGIIFLVVMIIFFIPPLLISLHPKAFYEGEPSPTIIAPRINRFANLCIRYRMIILITAVTVFVISIFGAFKLDVETDIHQFFRKSSPMRQAIDIIAEKLRGTTPINIILKGDGADSMESPEVLKAIEKVQNNLDKHPAVGKTTSVVDYLKIINRALHDNDQKYYFLPDSENAISQYLLAYSLADSKRTLDRYIDYDRGMANIALRSSLTSSSDILKFKQYIEELCSDLFPSNVSYKVTSDTILVSLTAQHISNGILLSFALASFVILIIIILLFRSIKMGLIAMIPNILPILFILGVMGFFNIEFNIGTSLIICIAIGIAVDDTIHFLVRYFYELKQTNHYLIRSLTGVRITTGQRQAIRTTMLRVRRPIVLTSVAVCLGFSVLAFSQFVPIASFGLLTAFTMLYCLLCDLVILPALLASISI